MSQLNNPFVPQPPTYIPPAQTYKGHSGPIVATPAPEQVLGYTSVKVPLQRNEKQKGQLFKIAFLATIGFVILSHHVVYRIVNSFWSAITGKTHEITCEIGCPTTKGVLLHGFVFFIYMMFLLFA